MIYVIGDSHARSTFGVKKDGSMTIIDNVNAVWLGPITMERIGYPDDTSIPLTHTFKSIDRVVYVFGEIDVRIHVKKRSEVLRVSVEKYIDERLVDRYLMKIDGLRTTSRGSHNIMSVVPPVHGEEYNSKNMNGPMYAISSSDEERSYYTEYLNKRLQEGCEELGLGYLDIYSMYKDDHGMARNDLTDCSGHITDATLVRDHLKSIGWIS